MIGILNLQLGNLRSISNSVYEMGFDFEIIDSPEQFDDISHLIMPGVGFFSTAMQQFTDSGLIESVKAFQQSGRPLMGICLGMQLLATCGYEGGKTQGLGLIPGEVKPFTPNNQCRVPHMGWNAIEFTQEHAVFSGIKDKRDFYFVHSYHYVCDSSDNVAATTQYGERFPSVVVNNNVVGVQFHPEKSQKNGLKLLENFCDWSV